MRRTQPTTKKAKISSTTHVQMLQWLHGKQQQQHKSSLICKTDLTVSWSVEAGILVLLGQPVQEEYAKPLRYLY